MAEIIERVPTGIPGLDKIIEGGIPRNSSILVSGTPGTAKTLFGLQYIVDGAINHGEPGIFLSAEDSPETVMGWFSRFGWDYSTLEKNNLIRIHTPQIKFDEGEDYFQYVENDNFIDIIKKMGAKRIVLDSLTVILEFSEGFGGIRSGVRKLQSRFHNLGLTSIFIQERKIPVDRLDYGMDQFVSDGTILLDTEKIGENYEKTLRVLKMRGTSHNRNRFILDIGNSGLSLR